METADYNKIAVKLSPLLGALSHPARLQIMLPQTKEAEKISEPDPFQNN